MKRKKLADMTEEKIAKLINAATSKLTRCDICGYKLSGYWLDEMPDLCPRCNSPFSS